MSLRPADGYFRFLKHPLLVQRGEHFQEGLIAVFDEEPKGDMGVADEGFYLVVVAQHIAAEAGATFDPLDQRLFGCSVAALGEFPHDEES